MAQHHSTTLSEGARRVVAEGRALLNRPPLPKTPAVPPRAGRPSTTPTTTFVAPNGMVLTLTLLSGHYGAGNDAGLIPAAQRYLEQHDPKFRALKAGSLARFDAARDLLRTLQAAEPEPVTTEPLDALAPLGPKDLPVTGVRKMPLLPELQKLYPKQANDLGRVMAWLEENDEAYAALAPDGFDGKLHVAGQLLDQLRRETANSVGASAVAELARRARERKATTLASAKPEATPTTLRPAPGAGGPLSLSALPGKSRTEKAMLALARKDPHFSRLSVSKQIGIAAAALKDPAQFVP